MNKFFKSFLAAGLLAAVASCGVQPKQSETTAGDGQVSSLASVALQQKIASIAKAEIGTLGTNRTRYGGTSSEDWCAYFVSWVWRQAGVGIQKTGSSQFFRQDGNPRSEYAKYWRTSINDAEPGDIIVWTTVGDSAHGHVGIAHHKMSDGTWMTIQGNGSYSYDIDTGAYKNHDNNGVWAKPFAKTIKISSTISKEFRGVLKIPVDSVGATVPAADPGVLQEGSSGPKVKALQYALNYLGASPQLIADGAFGPKTKAAVIGYQKANQLDVYHNAIELIKELGLPVTLPVEYSGKTDRSTFESIFSKIGAKQGSKGLHVKAIQTLLNAKGASLVVDGDYGPATNKAVVSFQGSNGLGYLSTMTPGVYESTYRLLFK